MRLKSEDLLAASLQLEDGEGFHPCLLISCLHANVCLYSVWVPARVFFIVPNCAYQSPFASSSSVKILVE